MMEGGDHMYAIRGPHVLCVAETLPAQEPTVRYQYRLAFLSSPFVRKWQVTIRLTGTATGWEWIVDGYGTWGLQPTAAEALTQAITFVESSYQVPPRTFSIVYDDEDEN